VKLVNAWSFDIEHANEVCHFRRHVYEHEGLAVFIDKEFYPTGGPRRWEIFVAYPDYLWCIGDFAKHDPDLMAWFDVERLALRQLSEYVERGLLSDIPKIKNPLSGANGRDLVALDIEEDSSADGLTTQPAEFPTQKGTDR